MRILIDTNILFSAILFKKSRVAKVLFYINENHEVFLTDQNIDELRRIIERKAPDMLQDIEKLLSSLEYEVVPAMHSESARAFIRDASDQPILNAAIINDLDIVLTGDKDFLSLRLDRPRCMNPAQFCELEGIY